MTFAQRFASCLFLLALAAPLAGAETQTTPAVKTGDHAYTNPGKLLPCEFRSGTLTATGLINAKGCDPNRDSKCALTLEVVSIKDDSVRSWQAHDPETKRCTIKMEDGRKRVLGPMWRKSDEGDKLVRVTGVMTDGVMGVSRFRVLGEAGGLR